MNKKLRNVKINPKNERVNLESVLVSLASESKINEVLVEAGPTLSADFIEQGLVGEPTQVLVRDSHSGILPTKDRPNGMLSDEFLDPALAQGGVLIDLCHSVYLTRYFLGRPESITASFGYVTGRNVEDNAVLTMQHANGSIGVAHAGYVTCAAPFNIEVHGTEGTIVFDQERLNEIQLFTRQNDPATDGFRTILTGPLHPPYSAFLPNGGHNLGYMDVKICELHDLLTSIESGEDVWPNFEAGLIIEKVMDAVDRSAREQRWVNVE